MWQGAEATLGSGLLFLVGRKGTETLGYLRTKLTNQLALLVGRTRRTHLPCHHALSLALVPGWPLGNLKLETSRY